MFPCFAWGIYVDNDFSMIVVDAWVLMFTIVHPGLTSKLLSLRPKKLRWRRTSTTSSPSERRLPPVHVALIASVGEPPYGRQALATLRSALYHAKTRKWRGVARERGNEFHNG